MRYVFALVITLLLVGCMDDAPTYRQDPKLRQEIFFKCLAALPAGPQSTKYNDWDEVVNECGRQAEWMAKTCVTGCN